MRLCMPYMCWCNASNRLVIHRKPGSDRVCGTPYKCRTPAKVHQAPGVHDRLLQVHSEHPQLSGVLNSSPSLNPNPVLTPNPNLSPRQR